MIEEEDVPSLTPEASGSYQKQSESQAQGETPAPSMPTSNLPLERTMEGIATAHPRGLGTEVTTQLVVGAVTQLSYHLHETKQERPTTAMQL